MSNDGRSLEVSHSCIIAGALLACLLAGCSPAPSESAGDTGRSRAAAWLKTARFEDADRAIDCQPDCREQERGFAYARDHHVDQPGDCDLARAREGANEDFIEGCRAYGQYLEAAARKP
jgi:hypothetical protein